MNYLVLPNATAASNRLAQIDAQLGYPNPATKTERYATAFFHSDGRAAVPIETVHSPAQSKAVDVDTLLTNQERNLPPAADAATLRARPLATRATRAAMDEDGWFPINSN